LRWGFCELANTPAQFAGLKAEYAELKESGYAHETRLVEPEQIRQQVVNSGVYAGGLIDMGSGHLHPLELVLGEARLARPLACRIFEQSPVLELIHGSTVQVRCAGGTVRAGSLVLACNAHLEELEPKLSGKVLPAGSYIIATEPLSAERATVDPAEPGAVRPESRPGLLPALGGPAPAVRRCLPLFRTRSGGHRRLHAPADAQGVPATGGRAHRLSMGRQDRHLRQSLPAGRTFEQHPNVFYAQGYSGHGLNVTHWCAKLLGEAIHAGHSQGIDVFSACLT
jgi:gamma-glutamylputrescine oxidase